MNGNDLSDNEMGVVARLRSARGQMERVASQLPPPDTGQVHTLVGGCRQSQLRLRRQADRYLLVFCVLVLGLAASILWRTASAGITVLNVAIAALAVLDVWVAARAGRSLWLMRQPRRRRPSPYRLARRADRLQRLSHRRRWWLALVLAGSYAPPADADGRRREFVRLRLPSYSIAACILLLVALNTGTAFAATPAYAKITTTTDRPDAATCDTLATIIDRL